MQCSLARAQERRSADCFAPDFVGGIAAALGYLGVIRRRLFAQTQGAAGAAPRARAPLDEYDSFAKLASNENKLRAA